MPDKAAALLAEVYDDWQVFDRRYLSEGSMARLDTTDTENYRLPTYRQHVESRPQFHLSRDVILETPWVEPSRKRLTGGATCWR